MYSDYSVGSMDVTSPRSIPPFLILPLHRDGALPVRQDSNPRLLLGVQIVPSILFCELQLLVFSSQIYVGLLQTELVAGVEFLDLCDESIAILLREIPDHDGPDFGQY